MDYGGIFLLCLIDETTLFYHKKTHKIPSNHHTKATSAMICPLIQSQWTHKHKHHTLCIQMSLTACRMLSVSTILGGGLGGWLNTDYKASLSPAELHCCWNWAELGNIQTNENRNMSCEENLNDAGKSFVDTVKVV